MDALPQDVVAALDNVVVCVEDDSEDGDKLGEYLGVPRIERLTEDVLLPDRIVLYQVAIEEECEHDEERVAEEIRRTLWHEIAHHLGWDEDTLEEAEQKRGW